MNYNQTRQSCGCRSQRSGRTSEVSSYDPPEFGMPIGMSFTPWQQWGETFSSDVALCKGTMFPCLDLPFKGVSQRRFSCNG